MVGTIPPFNSISHGLAGLWIRRSVAVVILFVLCAGAMGSAGAVSTAGKPGAGPTSQECAIVEAALRWLETTRGVSNPVLIGCSTTGLGLGRCFELVSLADEIENADALDEATEETERGSSPPGFEEWYEDLLRRELESDGLDRCKQEIQETQQLLGRAFPDLWAEAVEQSFDGNLDPTDWSKCEFMESGLLIYPSWRVWEESWEDQGRPLDAELTAVGISRAAIHDRYALVGLEYLRSLKSGEDMALFLRLDAHRSWVVREAKEMGVY